MMALDMDFVALPKIELHAHLSGSISRQCLHEVWVQKKEKGETELEDPLVVMPEGKFDYDLDTFFPLFSTYIYALINDLPSITHTTLSVLSSFASDGVCYLELRTTPRAIPSASITQESYITHLLAIITQFNSTHPSMKTCLILSIDRRTTPSLALSTVHLALKHRHLGIVGIDLCGDPSLGSVSQFSPAFKLAKENGLKITIHFGEIAKTVEENELETILSWGPERLGHVIHVPEKVREMIRGMGREGGIGLEFCLSCNVKAKMMGNGTGEESFKDHHFGWWWDREREGRCRICLSTDDVGVFGSSLSNEYRLAAEHFNLSRRDICDLARGAIDVIFGSEEDKERLRGLMWKE